MANTPTTGARAAGFNLDGALRLLHQTVYGSAARPPLRVDTGDYHLACDHFEAVGRAAQALQRSADGLCLLRELLTAGGDHLGWQAAHTEAVAGLLQPLERELAHHADALKAAIRRD